MTNICRRNICSHVHLLFNVLPLISGSHRRFTGEKEKVDFSKIVFLLCDLFMWPVCESGCEMLDVSERRDFFFTKWKMFRLEMDVRFNLLKEHCCRLCG